MLTATSLVASVPSFRPHRYRGSLTAPPCTENVVWTVFKHTGKITLKQLSAFDKLVGNADRDGGRRDAAATPLGDNFRVVQARCSFAVAQLKPLPLLTSDF